MRLSKKLSILFICFALVFSLVACGGQSTPAEQPATEEPAITSEEIVTEAVNGYFANMPKDIYKIKQDAFLDKVANGEDMFVLDIRQAADYEKGHVKGAFNAPWGPAIAESLANIPADKTVYVYCYSGQTAGQAVATLNMAGFNAKSVNLGFNFGISKVDGYEAFIETAVNEFGDKATEIKPAIQEALTAYYAGLADVKETIYKNYKISEASLRNLIDNGDDSIYILSIRSEEDYSAGHIAGAEQMSFGKGMQENFASLPTDKTIVVYCYTGQTAGQTTAGLRLLGFDAVSLNGGMGMSINAPLGWANKGYPVNVVEEAAMNYFVNLPDDINKIKQDAFLEKVSNGEDMFVLDIRQADAYEAGHVKGAVNAPWGPAIAENLEKLPTDKIVYVYCYSGQTAGQAVATLQMAGINAKSVNLGFNFGISKVDGYEASIETTVNEFGEAVTEIAPAMKETLTSYYAGLADVKETIFKNYKISEQSLKDLMDAGDESIYILSIRGEKAFNEGHIEGANLLAYGKGMQEGFNSLPRDKTIVVYCYTGQTAGQTTAVLRALGYNAVSLNGGMGMDINAPHGWANKGFEVVQ